MPDPVLFDVYPHPRQSALVIWIKHGDQTTKRLVPYQPHFCIKAEAEPLETAERILAKDKRVERFWRDEVALWLRGPKEPVLRIQPKRLQQMHAVAQDLRKATKSKGFLFFDVDNQPESRWMHEQGLFSMCRLAVEGADQHARCGHVQDHVIDGDSDGQDHVIDGDSDDQGNVIGGGSDGQGHVIDGVGHDQDNLIGKAGARPPGGAAAAHIHPHDLVPEVAGETRGHVEGPGQAAVPGVAGGTRSQAGDDTSHLHVEADVAGGTRCDVSGPESRGPASVAWPLRLASDEQRFIVDYPNPALRTLWLEVEVDKQGHVAAFTDPLIALKLGIKARGDTELRVTGSTEAERTVSERGILIELGRRLRELDPDVIFTQHGDRFDIPYLLRRIRLHGLQEWVWLGRDRDPDPAHPDQEGKSISTYGRWLYKSHAYYLRGRWHIDLSKKTLDSDDDRKDIHGILYLARISNRRAQDVNRNGAGYALQQMQIDAATDMGVALPWKRNLAEDWKDAATLCAVDRGGQIMVPTPGIYEDVAACDFSGYYPSIVVEHNLSSDTINCACCPDGPMVPELGYHVCKEQGHQSAVLKRIAEHRKWAKAVLKRARGR